jgi:hypothetical protein
MTSKTRLYEMKTKNTYIQPDTKIIHCSTTHMICASNSRNGWALGNKEGIEPVEGGIRETDGWTFEEDGWTQSAKSNMPSYSPWD